MAKKKATAPGPGRKPQYEGVDDFIWAPFGPDPYVSWVLMFFRLPAAKQIHWARFMEDKKLFCSYTDPKTGKKARYRVTGASRLGDVWLTTDFEQDMGYELRVDINRCKDWGPAP